jgi:hypothetical protein
VIEGPNTTNLIQYITAKFRRREELYIFSIGLWFMGKDKAVPLQAWTGPEGSWSLRLPDFKTIGT